jgi:hypothetical protein
MVCLRRPPKIPVLPEKTLLIHYDAKFVGASPSRTSSGILGALAPCFTGTDFGFWYDVTRACDIRTVPELFSRI